MKTQLTPTNLTSKSPTLTSPINKSLFDNFLVTAVVPAYHRMNSFLKTATETSRIEMNSLTLGNLKFNFTFKVPNTEINMNRELEQLTDLHTEGLESWISNFRDTIGICDWTEIQALNILRSIIHPTLFPLIKQFSTVDTNWMHS